MGYQEYLAWRRRDLRTTVAADLSRILGYNYEAVLRILEQWDAFGNWTLWEANHRPVNLEELAELVQEALN